jgi:hypothetical protein
MRIDNKLVWDKIGNSMSELPQYTIHFGKPKRSKYFPQAIELAGLAKQHEIRGTGDDEWHIVTISEDQLDLLATLYPLAEKLPLPKVYGADLQYLFAYAHSGGTYDYYHASKNTKEKAKKAAELLMEEKGFDFEGLTAYLAEEFLSKINTDMQVAKKRLVDEGMIDYIDQRTGTWVRASKEVREPVLGINTVKERIRAGDYAGAVKSYYEMLGKEYSGPLTYELIYLKRLARLPLEPRDYLYFKHKTAKTDLIDDNIEEFLECIEETLEWARSQDMQMPMEIVFETVPTMEELLECRRKKWHEGVYIKQGKIERDFTPVKLDGFTYTWDWCQDGRFFPKYPDPILFSRALEPQQRKEALGLWITYSPEFLDKKVYRKGLHINAVDIYFHREWGKRTPKAKRDPDFIKASTLQEISYVDFIQTETVESIDPGRLHYTGRKHVIEGQSFFEVDIITTGGNIEAEVLANPFLETIDEILREAENRLRERHGLPRIGEGWVSEMELYHLIHSIFPSAIHHARPNWLKPQHLDVFIPDMSIAIEYHGAQHFEPVDLFGGEKALQETRTRDARKEKKCKENGVRLLVWRYDEPIEAKLLHSKISATYT